MLEKIGAADSRSISTSDSTVLAYLELLLKRIPDPVFYEIGVGVGATTLPVARKLDNRGLMVLFSYAQHVRELAADLAALGFNNVNAELGSPQNTYSGYHFELARAFTTRAIPTFDRAYIDGGHVFHLDAPAACILKELCKPGGFMLFDDWSWNIATSPTLDPRKRPQTLKDYDPVQIDTCQVQLVCQCVMDVDDRYRFIEMKDDTAV
jgi:SAM-dependent methyltransferase